ncbi:DUF6090 family protein [Robiginitalea marina]|uniref:DUF6090 family protein n=1 Tax=Robiginitalea marina TaxID=2954105 RepID=A0ABT1AYA0_9FLAO|nr:DUF6090 family protein [Robiginitalea marina]MCO5725011.1 DUF6090 family protein [Robiginitalea marina]
METGKTGRYLTYAIGEIVLVVIGILIALQINNWNEIRKDKKKEAVFLEQIHVEFTENKAQFLRIKGFHEKSLSSCIWMISHQPFKTVALDSLRHHSLWSRVSYTYDPSQSSLKSLISTGAIDLIQDVALREVLIGWQDLVDDYLEEEKEMREFTVNYVVPFSIQHFKLYHEEERFDAVLNFDQKQLDQYLNLIARKKRILEEILGGFSDKMNGESQSELEKVMTAMDVILERTRNPN